MASCVKESTERKNNMLIISTRELDTKTICFLLHNLDIGSSLEEWRVLWRQESLSCYSVGQSQSSPRRKPAPQAWRPPIPPPPPPAPASGAAGLLLGGAPNPDTPPRLLGRKRYRKSGVDRKDLPPRSMGYLNIRKKYRWPTRFPISSLTTEPPIM